MSVLRLTERGWLVAGLVVVAAALGVWWRYPGLLALAGAFGGLLLIDVAVVARRGRIRVQRVVEPLQVPRHGRCEATLTITDHSGRRIPTIVDGSEPVGDELVPVPASWLRSRRPVEVGYVVPSHRRGVRTVGPTRLRRLGPTGLAARRSVVGESVAVLVLPRVLPVRAMPAGARRGQVTSDERVARGGTDLVGMHEYVPGDDLRHVHWAASARTGSLMVRDDADPSHAELTVLLDDRVGSYATADSFEEAVDVAAALVAAASAAGHPVRLRTVAGRVDVGSTGTAGTGPGRAAPELVAALADVSLVESGSTDDSMAHDLDVVALISGSGGDPAALALQAGRAMVGVVLVVDERPAVHASGSVLVLRGQRAEDLLSRWDSVVAGGTS